MVENYSILLNFSSLFAACLQSLLFLPLGLFCSNLLADPVFLILSPVPLALSRLQLAVGHSPKIKIQQPDYSLFSSISHAAGCFQYQDSCCDPLILRPHFLCHLHPQWLLYVSSSLLAQWWLVRKDILLVQRMKNNGGPTQRCKPWATPTLHLLSHPSRNLSARHPPTNLDSSTPNSTMSTTSNGSIPYCARIPATMT